LKTRGLDTYILKAEKSLRSQNIALYEESGKPIKSGIKSGIRTSTFFNREKPGAKRNILHSYMKVYEIGS